MCGRIPGSAKVEFVNAKKGILGMRKENENGEFVTAKYGNTEDSTGSRPWSRQVKPRCRFRSAPARLNLRLTAYQSGARSAGVGQGGRLRLWRGHTDPKYRFVTAINSYYRLLTAQRGGGGLACSLPQVRPGQSGSKRFSGSVRVSSPQTTYRSQVRNGPKNGKCPKNTAKYRFIPASTGLFCMWASLGMLGLLWPEVAGINVPP